MNSSFIDQPISEPPFTKVDYATPNCWQSTSFFVRSNGLKVIRAIRDCTRRIDAPNRNSELLPVIIAESITPLRYVSRPEEKVFEEGKVKNLKVACDRINGLVVEPSGAFSFWRIVGRPSKGNGFVVGREIREGCLIPTIGGGLCQLSGSLYSVAIQAGLMIVERHGHTRRLQDAYFDESRDATVFWNYVDLRFSSATRFQLETFLTEHDLVVRLRAERATETVLRKSAVGATPSLFVSDCLTCGRDDCSQSRRTKKFRTETGRMVLADRLSPEFYRFLQGQVRAHDVILSPRRSASPLAGSLAPLSINVKTFPWTGLKRSVLSRLGSRRKIAAWIRISGARLLAHRYEREIRQQTESYLFIEQELLPHLWARGALIDRKFCVLASRLPSSMLQRRLDALHERHPDRESLREFRMEAAYSAAEDQALKAADRIVSPHEEVVQSIPGCERIPWEYPRAAKMDLANAPGRDAILFPATTAAREGAYEVRAAALELGLKLVAFERNIEHPGFWNGVDITFCSADSIPWDRIAAVMHPAAFISSPRTHLRAIASGIPILASRGCGLPAAQFVDVEIGASEDLIFKIQNYGRRLSYATETR
jgi:hypothetical protein